MIENKLVLFSEFYGVETISPLAERMCYVARGCVFVRVNLVF